MRKAGVGRVRAAGAVNRRLLRIKEVHDDAQDFRMQLAQQAIDFRSEPPMEGHCQWQHDPGPAERLNLQNDTGSSYLQVEKDQKAFLNSLYKI
jgi:hypothetical protein